MKDDSQILNSILKKSSHRDVLKWGGKVVAASNLAGVVTPALYAGEDNTIRLVLSGQGVQTE